MLGAKIGLPPSARGAGLSVDCDLLRHLPFRPGVWDLDAHALGTVGYLVTWRVATLIL